MDPELLTGTGIIVPDPANYEREEEINKNVISPFRLENSGRFVP